MDLRVSLGVGSTADGPVGIAGGLIQRGRMLGIVDVNKPAAGPDGLGRSQRR
jgi:hypothetical protein